MQRFFLICVAATGSLLLALPLAAAPGGSVQFLNSGKVLPADLPFSEAVRVGDTLYLSGMVGVIPGSMKLMPGGIKEESLQVLENIRATLKTHGFSMSDLVKCTVMLADISEWAAFNEVYQSYLSTPYPARSDFGANVLALGASVEVECISVAGAR